VAIGAGLVAAVLVAALVSLVGAWRPVGATETAGPATTGLEYLPGRAADVYLPRGARAAPVVVLVPGGAWRTADRGGLTPLARALAASGVVAVNATYRAAATGGRHPQMAGDVVCAADFGVDRARRAGIVPGPVVVLGHSAGAHLAALAALAPQRFRVGCPYPAARVDGLVGLAGAYDVSRLPELAEPLFGAGAEEAPARWRDGNPLTWAGAMDARAGAIRALLVHGTRDTALPTSFTTGFASALTAAGVPTTVELVDGQDHGGIYPAPVAGPIVTRWMLTTFGA
jgi:acetyl esterase/lipase